MPERLLTMNEAAEMLRTPIDTLRYWRQQGLGPQGFKVGRRVLYTESDLQAFVDEQRNAQRSA